MIETNKTTLEAESKLDYVQRKLSDPKNNIGAISREMGISRFILDKITKGGDIRYSLIESLYIYFKNSAD